MCPDHSQTLLQAIGCGTRGRWPSDIDRVKTGIIQTAALPESRHVIVDWQISRIGQAWPRLGSGCCPHKAAVRPTRSRGCGRLTRLASSLASHLAVQASEFGQSNVEGYLQGVVAEP